MESGHKAFVMPPFRDPVRGSVLQRYDYFLTVVPFRKP
ncbi:Hypothetical protein ABZS17H1_03500 [Kosakonia cowanii]